MGIASKDTKKPEKSRKGTDMTGAKNTPFCTFIAAPTTRPTDCATKAIIKQAAKNMPKRKSSHGCEVK